MDLELHRKNAERHKKTNKKLVQQLKRRPPKDLDRRVHNLHEEVFEEIDCLDCANCCKTTSPIFLDKDIERLASHFRVRPAEFIQQYLFLDKEGHYVLQTAPCPFLGADNYCSVYENRPRACREYPHTNRKRFAQILNLSYKNTFVCPAVLEIFERLRNQF